MRWARILVLAAGCYRPTIQEGVPCSSSGECPGALHCDTFTHTCISSDGMPPPCNLRGVSAGRAHTCAIDEAGSVWCWGLNDLGQAAPGGPRFALDPVKISLPGTAAQVAAGRSFSCARLDDG